MSSILDALRKSEAERLRGRPPGLNSPMPFHTRPRRRNRPWLLPALAVLALAGAWAGGLFDFGGDDPAPPPVAATEPQTAPVPGDPAVGTAVETAQVPPPAPPLPAAADPATPVDTPAPAADSAPAPSPRVGFGPFPRSGARRVTQPPAAPANPTAPPVAAAPPPASPADTQAPAPAQAIAQTTPPPAETAPAPTTAPPADAPPAAPAPAPATPVAATPAAPGVPTVNELPFAFRRGLPELAVTMHMYSTDPERRFVLINGQRARDGQALEGGLEVKEIRIDGVVLRFQDTEFLLPVRS